MGKLQKPQLALKILAITWLILTTLSVQAGDPFKEATIIQVTNDVKVVPAAAPATAKPAEVNATVKAPDLVQTGPKSRCELRFADQTVTRVGANTSFSMDPTSRGISLQQGSLLFHSPTGKGGGRIQTAAATAAVTGTTIAVTATSNGGFKIMVFEGTANVQTRAGISTDIAAGHLTFIMPGQLNPTRPIEFDLSQAVMGAGLIHGFEQELPSKEKIENTVQQQKDDFAKGKAEPTNILVGDATSDNTFQLILDPGTQSIIQEENGLGAFVRGALEDLKRDLVLQDYADAAAYARRLSLKDFLKVLDSAGADDISDATGLIAGIFANNMEIVGPYLDMTNLSDTYFTEFFAAGNMTFGSNVTFFGGSPFVTFSANNLSFAPDSYLYFPDALYVSFYGNTVQPLNGVTFTADGALFQLTAGGTLDLQNTYFYMENGSLALTANEINLNNVIFHYMYDHDVLLTANTINFNGAYVDEIKNFYAVADTINFNSTLTFNNNSMESIEFYARNIYSSSSDAPLGVNSTSLQRFIMTATESIDLQGGLFLNFSEMEEDPKVYLTANSINIQYGFTINSDYLVDAKLEAHSGPITLSGLSFSAPDGSSFYAHAGSITGTGTFYFDFFDGNASVSLDANSIDLSGFQLSAYYNPVTIDINANGGPVTIGSIALEAPSGSSFLARGGSINISNGDFTYFNADIAMNANTITLQNVNLNSSYSAYFYTTTGNWYDSAGHPGSLNLVNTTYGGTPITGSGGPGLIMSGDGTGVYSQQR